MKVKIEWGNSGAEIRHEFYIKYDWYAYEGCGGYEEYVTPDINDAIRFIEFCEAVDNGDYRKGIYGNSEDYRKYFHGRPNGHLQSFQKTIHKRTIIEEKLTKEDLVAEKRNCNLAVLLEKEKQKD